VANTQVQSLAEVVERITEAGDGDGPISVQEIVESVGQRSFGALLLVPGLIVLSPISGIPGVPTLGGIAVLLIAGQMLIGRESFWLPGFIVRRTITRERMGKGRGFLLPVARFVDRVIRPRLTRLTKAPFSYVIAATCVLIALVMPPLEAILFANVATAAAISAFGLSLVAHDGLLALVAFGFTGGAIGMAVTALV
jgi:hypothetical protein